ncbi:MAG: MBOAT family protein, partial [Lachnospiraceae bacterium]|nr:MBOAT family protein [Lachnospiraceae bacterium]
YQIIGGWLRPIRERIGRILKLHPDSLGIRILKIFTTFLLVDFSWIYFRSDSLHSAHAIVASIFGADNPWILFDGSLYQLGLSEKNFRLMLVCICVLLFADVMKRRGICIRQKIAEQDYVVRWLVIAIAIVFILTFGIYGPGYKAANFIYFQF